MKDDDLVRFLMKEFGWWEVIAQAMVRADGKCEYCEEDLLKSRSGYSSIVLDHILPKRQYPHLAENGNNHALACSSCNTMKGAYDPAGGLGSELPSELSADRRMQLIGQVKAYLSEKIDAREREWERISQAFNS